MTDLTAIRARDHAVTPADMKQFSAVAQAAHDDRAALLAEVEQHDALVVRFAEDATRWAQGATALRLKYDAAQAALDRLARLTGDDIAQVIAETKGQSPSGIEMIWHGLPWAETSAANQTTYRAMAAAVLARLRARADGP